MARLTAWKSDGPNWNTLAWVCPPSVSSPQFQAKNWAPYVGAMGVWAEGCHSKASCFLVKSKAKGITRQTWKRLGKKQDMLGKLEGPRLVGVLLFPQWNWDVGVQPWGRPHGGPRKPDPGSKASASPQAKALPWGMAFIQSTYLLSTYYAP